MRSLLWLLIPLAFLAPLPRILTLLHLWQLKEWRIDRLREHLRAEGWITQLFGYIEPVWIALMIAIAVSVPAISIEIITIGLAGLIVLGIVKLLTRRQPMPIWTKKALAIYVGSKAFTWIIALAMYWLRHYPALLMLPVIAPVIITISYIAFLPIDRLLKNRVFAAARSIRSKFPDLVVIGIAGSVGKTTTKELLAHILAGSGTRSTPEHVNTEMGVSHWLLSLLRSKDAPNVKTLIVEMGAYKRGEIALTCSIVQPQYGAITFIGQDHLALFGSEEDICAANAELFASLPSDGTAFVNIDNTACEQLMKAARSKMIKIGTGNGADITALDIVETGDGLTFSVDGTPYGIPLRGTHNVTNALLAIGIARTLGMPHAYISRRAASFAPPKNTFALRHEGGITIVDDTHNASPQSFRAAIEWAKSQPHDRKILLTSGVIELGEQENTIHTELGALSRDVFSDAYFTGKKFIDAFRKGFGERAHLLAQAPKLDSGTLLVCVGRMPQSTIQSFLS